ncbi:MAG: hypothetical protein E6R03_06705 [Hyphomicrobiaceae bacterium]|nr:MAG: hypothetical protein E6R03_06705 [Hyphomicrobiaceae bacterium]
MHRSVSRVLSPANDAQGRPLRIWWPDSDLADRRTVEAHFHDPPIPAFLGQGRRESVPTNLGLTAIPQVTVTFAAEFGLFPAAVPPEEGVCFLAGPSLAEATLYRTIRATTVAGLVEIEATVER